MNADDRKTLARLRRKDELSALRDGRKRRAKRQPDKRKQASKRACRGKVDCR